MANDYLDNCTPIMLSYTEKDWDRLESSAKAKGYPDFRSYLNAALHSAAKKIEEEISKGSQSCIKCKRGNKYFIPEDISGKIRALADRHCMPLTSAVRLYFVDPMLVD